MVPSEIDVRLIIILFAALGLTDCASTRQYSRFAHVGSIYTAVLDRVLVVAGKVEIDANSERLLQDDALSNRSLADYRAVSKVDVDNLKTISVLRAHGRLLGRYFSLLNDLATSDAPDRTKAAIDGTVVNLNQLGATLRGSELMANAEAPGTAAKLVVAFGIHVVLREELGRRKETIEEELKTQEVLLPALAKAIETDVRMVNDLREERWVIEPLIAKAPISNPDEWVTRRRTVLTAEGTVGELRSAAGAARELRESFEDLVRGTLTLDRLNDVLTDLEATLALIEVVNR